MNKYGKNFEIYYYDVDKFNRITPLSILNYLEETAISHSWSVGLGCEELYEKGYAWVLSKWHVEIERYPSFKDKIYVETWASSFDRYFANRWFTIKDEKGNIIIRAASQWILIDIDKRKAVKIPKEISDCYGVVDEIATDESFMNFEKVEIDENKRKYEIRRSDIDTNGHVNNKKYIEWIIETIPDEVYESYYLSSFDVLYKKETSYGHSIYSTYMEVKKDEHSVQYHHLIRSEDDTELARIYTKWVKRV